MARPNREFGLPAYERIAEDLRSRIESGRLADGEMLPGRRTLAVEYGVSLPTIERAVANLIQNGTLRVDNRRGTFVSRPAGKTEEPPKSDVLVGIMAPMPFPFTTEAEARNGTVVIVSALERSISRLGCRTIFLNLSDAQDDRIAAAAGYESLVEKGAQVVVGVNALRQADLGPIRQVAATGSVPLVVVNDEKVSPPMLAVHYDHGDAAYQAANHLLDAGCDRLVFFSARVSTWGDQRWIGVQAAAKDANLPPDALIDRINRQTIETDAPIMDPTQGGYDFGRQIALEDRKLFTHGRLGIVSANDQMACGLIQALKEAGFELSRDYLIVGFDDIVEAREIGLSTMRPPLEDLGTEAASLAMQAAEGSPSARRVCLHSHLVARQSSRFAREVAALKRRP